MNDGIRVLNDDIFEPMKGCDIILEEFIYTCENEWDQAPHGYIFNTYEECYNYIIEKSQFIKCDIFSIRSRDLNIDKYREMLEIEQESLFKAFEEIDFDYQYYLKEKEYTSVLDFRNTLKEIERSGRQNEDEDLSSLGTGDIGPQSGCLNFSRVSKEECSDG